MKFKRLFAILLLKTVFISGCTTIVKAKNRPFPRKVSECTNYDQLDEPVNVGGKSNIEQEKWLSSTKSLQVIVNGQNGREALAICERIRY